jgi:hypothetical protein
MEFDSESEKQAFHEMMQATKASPVSAFDLQKKYGLEEEFSWYIAVQAMQEGQPVCFSGWLEFTLDASMPSFWRATSTEDFADAEEVLCGKEAELAEMRNMIEKAKAAAVATGNT